MYDPWAGRWWGVDPLADKYSDLSPYNYGVNNPVLFIGPNGMEITFSGSGYHATGQEAINAYWGLVQQEEKRSSSAPKKDVSFVVTDEVVGTGNVYAQDQRGTDIYFAINIYRMHATYIDVDNDGNESVITQEFEVLKYGVRLNEKTNEYEYALFNNGKNSDKQQVFSLESVTYDYDFGGFDITGPYDFHPQHRDIRGIPGEAGGRVNLGCIGVCGSGNNGWGGITSFLFGAAGFYRYKKLNQENKIKHLSELFEKINMSITVEPYSLPIGTPNPIKK